MNKVEIIGRLTRDPDVRSSTQEDGTSLSIARFTLAVDRRRSRDGQSSADFISCVALGKNGEFAERYFHKGMKIALVGRIQTGSYTNKDGVKVYTSDVVAEEFDFCESKGSGVQNTNQQTDVSGFMEVPDGIDEELPFT